MQPKLFNLSLIITLLLLALGSCKKEEVLPLPAKPGSQQPNPAPGNNPGNPNQPVPAVLKIAVKATIKVGAIDYDSIPAQLQIKQWDSSGAVTEKQVSLQPGSNELELPANTARVHLKMSQWLVQAETTLERAELNQGKPIVLHASKKARRLVEEASFYLANGEYYPENRTEYQYNPDGSLFNIRYWLKDVTHYEPQWKMNDRFYYTNGKLTEIKKYQFTPDAQPIITRIGYDASGKIATMFHDSYGVTTNARFEYGPNSVSIFHSYNNGHSLSYQMELAGGNKVKEQATTSRNGGEGGSFQYDRNINPFAHMNFPDLFLSKISKNNMVGQQKGFAGAFPSYVPYKWEYTYDNEGYPVQLLKHLKSGITGEHLRTIKYVYTYAAE